MSNNNKTKVGVIGGAGYVGAELIRLLINHPSVKLEAISSISFKNRTTYDAYPSFKNSCDLIFKDSDYVIDSCDLIFAALPAGSSEDLAIKCRELDKIFIDLGADFRLENESDYAHWYHGEYKDKEVHKESVYGLPELFRDEIKNSKVIANPGCYTTAAELALAPAVKAEIIHNDSIVIDCKSGATGAGKTLSSNTHFTNLNESIHPYKVAQHRHTPEIEQVLSKLCGERLRVTFVPHLIPVNRGILATSYAKLNREIDLEEIRSIYEKFYGNEFFIRLLEDGSYSDIHHVKYSNFCDISLHLDLRTDTLIVVSAIDNMVKGAAGQAIQNMNIVLGLNETTGLNYIPPAF